MENNWLVNGIAAIVIGFTIIVSLLLVPPFNWICGVFGILMILAGVYFIINYYIKK